MKEHYESQDLPLYYRTDHFYDFGAFFKLAPPKGARILNVGCGRGESLRDYPRAVGIDFNSKLLPLWESLGVADRCLLRSATFLDWSDNTFDWTVSTDFLEHVQPDEVELVVKELLRLAPRGRHVIDLRCQSSYRGPAGENLHPSALDAAQWEQLFAAYLGPGRRLSVSKQRKKHLFVTWEPIP